MSEFIVCPASTVARRAKRRATRTGRSLLLCHTPRDREAIQDSDAYVLAEEVQARHPMTEYKLRARRLWDRFCDLQVEDVPVREMLSVNGIDLLFAAEDSSIASLTHFLGQLDLAFQFIDVKKPSDLTLTYAPSEAFYAWVTAALRCGVPWSVVGKPLLGLDRVVLSLSSHYAESRSSRLKILHLLSRPAAMLRHVLRSSSSSLPKVSSDTVWIEVPNGKMARNLLTIAEDLIKKEIPVGFLLSGSYTISKSWASGSPRVSLFQLHNARGYLKSLFRIGILWWRMRRVVKSPTFREALGRSLPECQGILEFVLDQTLSDIMPRYVLVTKSAVEGFRRLNLARLVVHDERPMLQRALIAAAQRIGARVVAVQFGQVFHHGGMGPTPVDKFLACGPYYRDFFADPDRLGVVESVGFVATDNLYEMLTQREETRFKLLSSLGLRPDSTVVLLALSPLTGPEAKLELEQIVATVSKVVTRLASVLLVKLHPAEWQTDTYEAVLSGFPGLQHCVIHSQLSPQEAVVCGDVHITNGSTIGVDMLLTGKPMIDIPYNGRYYRDSYANAGVALRADTSSMLEDALSRVIEFPEEVGDMLNAGREKFILQRLTRFDGERAAAASGAILQFYHEHQID